MREVKEKLGPKAKMAGASVSYELREATAAYGLFLAPKIGI